jgi:hypothetical protein
MSCQDRIEPFERGYKQRTSITNSVRSRWTGKNVLADTVEHIATTKLGAMKRHGLIGESNLMLLEIEGVSIGIRNSGTQAKTNVSLRISPGYDHKLAVDAVEMIIKTLRENLVD